MDPRGPRLHSPSCSDGHPDPGHRPADAGDPAPSAGCRAGHGPPKGLLPRAPQTPDYPWSLALGGDLLGSEVSVCPAHPHPQPAAGPWDQGVPGSPGVSVRQDLRHNEASPHPTPQILILGLLGRRFGSVGERRAAAQGRGGGCRPRGLPRGPRSVPWGLLVPCMEHSQTSLLGHAWGDLSPERVAGSCSPRGSVMSPQGTLCWERALKTHLLGGLRVIWCRPWWGGGPDARRTHPLAVYAGRRHELRPGPRRPQCGGAWRRLGGPSRPPGTDPTLAFPRGGEVTQAGLLLRQPGSVHGHREPSIPSPAVPH